MEINHGGHDSRHKISLSFDNIVAEHDDEASFHIFLRYLFWTMLDRLKDYTNQREVSLLGRFAKSH